MTKTNAQLKSAVRAYLKTGDHVTRLFAAGRG